MSTYTVFLFRSGRVYVRDGAHVAPDAIQPPVLTSTVEAQTEYAALGKVMLQLHDAANQPYQHVCAPCDKPHVADTMISTIHTDKSCTADQPCLACTQRIYGL